MAVTEAGKMQSNGEALRQGEGDERIAEFFFGDFGMAAGGHDEILLAGGADAIRHGRGVAAHRKLGLPQLLAGLDVEGAEKAVGRAGDEDESTRRDDGSAETDKIGRASCRERG